LKKKKKINNIYQYLVWKFCKDPENVNWPKEIVIGKSLIKDFGEQIFKDLDFSSLEMESLAQFRTEKFKKYLKKQQKLSSLDFRKEHATIDKGVKADRVEIEKKPKTLIDFLRYGSEKEDKTIG
jgi:hypothetical protein|tara:strand:- start:128 stop:499 length:372 start_codon:yes stop_codon:yes gene_type:complete